LILSEGQLSDHRGARLLLPRLPAARELIAVILIAAIVTFWLAQ
jgi:hypothetical protein